MAEVYGYNNDACMLVLGIPITLTSSYQLKKHYENRGEILDIHYARTLGQALIYFRHKNSVYQAIQHSRKFIYGTKIGTSIASPMRQEQFFEDLAQEQERKAEFTAKPTNIILVKKIRKSKKKRRRNRKNKRKHHHSSISKKRKRVSVNNESVVESTYYGSDEEDSSDESSRSIKLEPFQLGSMEVKNRARKKYNKKQRPDSKNLSFFEVTQKRMRKSRIAENFLPENRTTQNDEETTYDSTCEVESDGFSGNIPLVFYPKKERISDEEICKGGSQLGSNLSKKRKECAEERINYDFVSEDEVKDQFSFCKYNPKKKNRQIFGESYYDSISEDEIDEVFHSETDIHPLPKEEKPKNSVCREGYFYEKHENCQDHEPTTDFSYLKLYTRDPAWPSLALKTIKSDEKTSLDEMENSIENQKSEDGFFNINQNEDFGLAFRMPRPIPDIIRDPRKVSITRKCSLNMELPPFAKDLEPFENNYIGKYMPISPLSEYCPSSASSDSDDCNVKNFKEDVFKINESIERLNHLFKKQEILDKKIWGYPSLETMNEIID